MRVRARAPNAHARSLCRPAQKQTLEKILTWKSDRPPLKVHCSSQANVATFLLWAIQNFQRGRARARARRSVCHQAQKHAPEHMLTWKPDRSPLRVHFVFQANIATSGLRATQNSQRRGAPTRRSLCRRAQRHTKNTMFTWKSDRPPVRVHFSVQANMATSPLW